MKIPFYDPYISGREFDYMKAATQQGKLSGNGQFSKKASQWLEGQFQTPKALLTTSCTSALEMAMLLLDLKPGDEVIMPSFTFVSTANCVALRGATPVFVDIQESTLNIDEAQMQEARSPRTRAVVPVHYAGVGCEMNLIRSWAEKYHIAVIEDAAQATLALFDDKPLGSWGDMAALSFHDTKNIHCGEGGALLVNNPAYLERAEVLWEKGTNRSRFLRGQVDKYTWVDLGSSFLLSELQAAFLFAQLEVAQQITARRLGIWNRYHEAFADGEQKGWFRRPTVPNNCVHNGHIYYLLVSDMQERSAFITHMKEAGITASFHYVPLHDAPAGQKYGRAVGQLQNTVRLSQQLVRLPLFPHMTVEQTQNVVDHALDFWQRREGFTQKTNSLAAPPTIF